MKASEFRKLIREEIKSTITESPSPYTPKERARVVKNLKDQNYLPAMPDADRKVSIDALENGIPRVIKHLSDKMREFDTTAGENEFNDGVRRGLALAIANLNEIK